MKFLVDAQLPYDRRRSSTHVATTPSKLLLVATGNIRNDDLLALFDSRLDEIATAFATRASLNCTARC